MQNDCEQADVFSAGADGVHTYRIPALKVSSGGALLAFCEARKISGKDASPTDLVLRRSLDQGSTWLPLQRVVPGIGLEAIMNPCPVVEGDITWLFCMNAHKTAPGHHRYLLLRSADDGLTWSDPVDVTSGIGDDTFIPGPGGGIALRNGKLIIPGYSAVFASDGTRVATYSRVAISADQGRSWHLGTPVAYAMSNESQVVERADGSLVLNWRIQIKNEGHPGCRGSAVSRDQGETWSEPMLVPALNEAPCQAGFISCRWPGREGAPPVLFSNNDVGGAAGGQARKKMTVRVSFDEGRSWPVSRLVHAGPSAYSSPAVLPDGRIGLLYECGESSAYEAIRLARFPLEWLSLPKTNM
jgi:sialidase-1